MKSGLSLSVLTLALLQTWQVNAQADDAALDDIERITVTSSRTEQANTELALSIGSVSKEVVEKDNAQHLSESLQTIPGVLINQLSGGQGHNAAIRMPVNYGGYTLYLQDNIPLQSAAFYNHNALWWASSNSSLSRLEVLKGAGTSLYGSGAVAATVNVLSAPIADDKNEVSVTLGEHNYQKYNGSVTLLDSNTDGLRLSAGYLNNQGWRDNSELEKSEFNALHEFTLDEKQSLKTSIVASSLDQQMSNSLNQKQFDTDATQSGLPDEVLAIDPRRKTDYLRVSTEYQYDSNDFYASVIPYARYRDNNYIATWQPNMPQVESSVRTLGLLALTNFQHSSNFETTLGIDVERSVGKSKSVQATTRTTTGWGAATYPAGHVFYDDETTFTALSPYIQHIGYLTNALSYTLGARYDHNKYDFDNTLPEYDNDGFGNRSIANRSDTFSHLSPKFSVNYQFDADMSVYARFANAIRIPTAGNLYHLKTKESSAQLGSLKEETSDTFEIGYKGNFEKLTLELAYYYMDVSDAIVTAYDDLGASYRVNASSVIHKGVELGVDYRFMDAFSVALAYSQSDHEFDHYIQDQGRVDYKTGESREQDLSGNSLQMAPEYVANLRFNYTSQAIEGLSLTTEVQSIGDYYMSVANKETYDGYTVVNLKANYQISDALKIHARIANLTDKHYALQSEIRYGRTRIQPSMPRTAYVGLKYAF